MSNTLKLRISTIIFCVIFFSTVRAGQNTTQSQSPAIGEMNDQSSIKLDNSQHTNISQYNNITSINNHIKGEKLNSLERKQEALLVAQNPTNLEIQNVQFVKYYSDVEQFLTITLKNISKLPANDVKVNVMNLSSASTYKNLKPYQLSKSNMIREQEGMPPLSIPPENEGVVLTISIGELRKKVLNIAEKSCIYGALLRAEESHQASNLLPNDYGIQDQSGASSTNNIGILLKIHYRSIFGQEYNLYNWIFIQTADRHSDFVQINTKNTKLTCLD